MNGVTGFPGIFDGMNTRKSKKTRSAEDNSDCHSTVSQGTQDEVDIATHGISAGSSAVSGFSFISSVAPAAVPAAKVVAVRRRVQKNPAPDTHALSVSHEGSQETESIESKGESKEKQDEPSTSAAHRSPFGFVTQSKIEPVTLHVTAEVERISEKDLDNTQQGLSCDSSAGSEHIDENIVSKDRLSVSGDPEAVSNAEHDNSDSDLLDEQSDSRHSDHIASQYEHEVPSLNGYQMLVLQKEKIMNNHRELLSQISKEARILNHRKVELINQRSSYLKRHKSIMEDIRIAEAKQIQCVENELYLEADSLNQQIEGLRKELFNDDRNEAMECELSDLDRQLFELYGNITRRLDTYATQLQDLEESHKNSLESFVTDTSEEIEKALKKNREEMEVSERQLRRAQADVDIQKQRDEKLSAKIRELTQEIRHDLDELDCAHDVLCAEIANLEEILRQKREEVRTIQAKRATLNAQVDVVRADFAENLLLIQHQLEQGNERVAICADHQKHLENEYNAIIARQEDMDLETSKRKRLLEDICLEVHTINENVNQRQRGINQFRSQFDDFSLKSFFAEQKKLNDKAQAIALGQESVNDQRRELAVVTEKLENLVNEVSECAKAIPELETAKKLAATNRAFKEAQCKADQIKRVSEHKAKLEAEIELIQTDQECRKQVILELEKNLESEQMLLTLNRSSWAKNYYKTLKRLDSSISHLLQEAEAIDGSHSVLEAYRIWAQETMEELRHDFAEGCSITPLNEEESPKSDRSCSSPIIPCIEADDVPSGNQLLEVNGLCESTELPLPGPIPSVVPPENLSIHLSVTEIQEKIDEFESELNVSLTNEDYDRCAELEELLVHLRLEKDKRCVTQKIDA